MQHLRLSLIGTLFVLFLGLRCPHSVHAQVPLPEYHRGTVTNIAEETQVPNGNSIGYVQEVDLRDAESGQVQTIQAGSDAAPLSPTAKYHVGQQVVYVRDIDDSGKPMLSIVDQYRLPWMEFLLGAFFVVVIAVALLKGLSSIVGMFTSLAVILFFMVPHIVSGQSPILISLIAAGIISALIIYFGHGWSYKSHISLLCMVSTLLVVALMSYGMVHVASLSGGGDENAVYLQFSDTAKINLQGLLLGGIILAALSVLDDSVISQVSVIAQMVDLKPHISFAELYKRGMDVGKDHISTLVNTLILAYAGSSLPLFILFLHGNQQPIWVSLNDQLIAEEVVRTLTGSIGLVLSIPLSTCVASLVLLKVHHRHKK